MNRRGFFKALGLGAVALSLPPGSLLAAGKTAFLTIEDFGAVADGETDCTAALQASIDSGADVYIPPGVYRITSQLKFSDKSGTLIGSGPRTVIKYKEVA